jgi:hypothetical protein
VRYYHSDSNETTVSSVAMPAKCVLWHTLLPLQSCQWSKVQLLSAGRRCHVMRRLEYKGFARRVRSQE